MLSFIYRNKDKGISEINLKLYVCCNGSTTCFLNGYSINSFFKIYIYKI